MADEAKELTRQDVINAVNAKGDPTRADPAVTARGRKAYLAGARAAWLMRHPDLSRPGQPSVAFDEAAHLATFDAKITGQVAVPMTSGVVISTEQQERMRAQLMKHGSPEIKAKLGVGDGKGPPIRSQEEVDAGVKKAAEEKRLADEAAAKAKADADAKVAADKAASDAAAKRVEAARAELAAAEAAIPKGP